MRGIAWVRTFCRDTLSIGDRLGEAFYGVWMVVVSIGLLNSGHEITPEHLAWVVLVCFGVNIVWGIIDGLTVMYGGVIDRAWRERLTYRLRLRPRDDAARLAAHAALDDTIAGVLAPEEKERIVDAIARAAPGPDPEHQRYRPTRDDWQVAFSIVAIDVGCVIPLVAPLVLIGDADLAVYASRMVATLLFAMLGHAYARQLNRSGWKAALLFGALGFAVFTLAYEAGW